MTKQAKEDYHLHVALKNGEAVVENVLCKVYLPKRFSDPLILKFRLSNDQVDVINKTILPIYSLQGEIKDRSGIVQTTIIADELWSSSGIGLKYWAHELMEISTLVGEPRNLEILTFLSPRESGGKSYGSFKITPNNLLAPAGVIKRSYTGEVKVENIWQQEFTLCNGVHLIFTDCYLYEELENGEVLTVAELVANFEIDGEDVDSAKINELRRELDDFLLLTSFASREWCICHGWDVGNSKVQIDYYRREMAIPEVKKGKVRSGNELIDLTDFRDFISTAYSKFIESGDKESLRQGIYAVVPRGNITVEKQFMTVYAAIESLVLAFRRKQGLEKIFSLSDWKRLNHDLRQWLQDHNLLAQNPDKYLLIQAKLGDLNRISFATAFDAFCQVYSVKVADLWNITGKPPSLSLSTIRNRIVHGEAFDRKKHQALSTALIHLQWILERMLLALLDWPVEKSAVGERRLASYHPHKMMQEHRELMAE